MPDKFDPYRESLVMETNTIWPEEFAHWDAIRKQQVADQLHSDPEHAAHLTYVRVHTGFCREITVTGADLERLGVQV